MTVKVTVTVRRSDRSSRVRGSRYGNHRDDLRIAASELRLPGPANSTVPLAPR